MVRESGTDAAGLPFNEYVVGRVWLKSQEQPGFVSYRRDALGAEIARYEYGQQTRFGWEIDHVKPVSAGGNDNLDNLQPLHWKNNRAKGDHYSAPECPAEI